jgi:hypothetical protein
LNPFDDYAIHQTPEPLAHPATSDPSAYDRYFFNGHANDGSCMFGVALGVYPHLGIIDASFSMVCDGTQTSVHASGRAPLDRTLTAVGPITVEIIKPLHTVRILVDADEVGVSAALTFSPATIAIEEPRHGIRDDTGTRTLLDATRFTQWGGWTGTITIDGVETSLEASTHWGLRDRSWGVRPLSAVSIAGAPAHTLPSFFWLWTPVRFDDRCVHLAANEHPDGRRWFTFAAAVPLLDAGALPLDSTAAMFDSTGSVEPLQGFDHQLGWAPGTRRIDEARVQVAPWNATAFSLTFEPLISFPMRGLGYLDPEWGHGRWHDEVAWARRDWRVAELDPADPSSLHQQHLCRVHTDDGRIGFGVLEHLAIGAHDPSGLHGFFDGFDPAHVR